MKTDLNTYLIKCARTWGLVLTCAVTGCASAPAPKTAAKSEAPAAAEQAADRAVQAVSLETTSTDGQESWLIEQGASRIPKVAGFDPKLPPHIEQRMAYAFDLAQRGATSSAGAEFQAVLGLCALELDSRSGGTSRRDALRQGLIALSEADQFGGDQVDWRESGDVRAIAAGHSTPILRQQETSAIDSIQAVQAYYTYAEERLSYACGGLAGSSLAFYGMGRTIAVPDTDVAHAAGKAALYHRVALAIAPQNVLAGNELGVLLVQHGRLEEAEKLFQQCVATNGSSVSRQNLLAVYARKREQQTKPDVITVSTASIDGTAAAAATGTTARKAPARQGAGDATPRAKIATGGDPDYWVAPLFRKAFQ